MEGPLNNQSSPEKPDMESVLEEMLRTSPIIGTGRDGIVMKVDISNIARSLNVIEDKENYALKILKVFKQGEAQKEYDLQMKAYSLLNDQERVVGIPKPILVKVQHLSPADITHLNNHGAALTEDAELILMDYIDGKDLATYVYDFILSKMNFGETVLESMSFEEKNAQVAQLLNFEFPANKDGFRELITNRDNLKKLVTCLQKTDFKLNEETLEKIENSIEILERSGIFHNDLHERNIMLDDIGNPFIIDFGRAVINKNDQESDDRAITRRFREINSGKNKKNDLRVASEQRHWENLSAKTNPSKVSELKFSLNGDGKILTNNLVGSLSEESSLDRILATLIFIAQAETKKEQKSTTTKIINFLKNFMETEKIELFARNKVGRFVKYLETLY